MRLRIVVLILVGVAALVAALVAGAVPSESETPVSETPGLMTDVTALVRENGVDPERSTLVIERLSDGATWIHHAERAEIRFPPASTSKIPHTLIALETKIASPDTAFEWDGVERFAESWNQDQTLASAFRRSAVWVYQEITTRLGVETMASWIDRFDYGNEDTGGADDLTTYWLRGPLEISAREQIDFLRRLIRRELPLSAATWDAAIPLMVRDRGEGDRGDEWTLYAKTGWMASEETVDIGWFVGWVEVGEGASRETYLFALNLDMPDADLRTKRESTVRHVLVETGILPASARE